MLSRSKATARKDVNAGTPHRRILAFRRSLWLDRNLGPRRRGAVAATMSPCDTGPRVHGVEMPITEVVAAVIDGPTNVPNVAAALMSRTAKPE